MKTYSYFTQNTLRIALCALLTGPLMTPGLADVFTVNNNNDSGSGSLRQAILEANAHPNSGAPDLIRFELTAANSRIQPLTPLDPITDSVTLDATSGNDCATAPAPQVEIDGQFAGAGANGLWAGTAATQLGVTIKGLAIYNFSGTGLYLFNNTNSLIAGNYLGTDATGQGFGKGNGVGLQIEDSRGVTVGGALPCARNVVSGNKNEGVRLADPSSDPTAGTTVIGNYIGVEARALMPMPNGIGVAVYAAGNQIGGAQAGMGNIIAGNFNDGIFVRGHLNHIQNNAIGTDPSGLAIWPNSHSGIYVEYGYTNDIVGNVIARNQRAGVGMFEAFETRIQQNSMFNNGGLGIDITPPGPNPNNPLHPGTGPNRKQNFPVIASAVALATGLHLHGTLNAEPNVTFVLEFFLNDACDPSGFGEGKTYLGPASVATDAAGNATFTAALAPIPPAPAGSRYITATATHPDGSSSEFSPCKLVTPTGPSVVEHLGLAHLPYGDATLQASNRFLRVSGLDATGSNGVTIALGGGRGWRGELGPLQLRGGDGLDVTLTEPFGPADPQDLSVAATGINIAWEPPSHGYTRITAKSACLACRHGLPPPNQPIPKGQLQLRLWDEASQLVDNIPLDNTTPLALSFCMASQTVAVASVAVLDSGDGGVACHYYLDEAVCFQAPPGKTYPPIKHLAVQFMDWPGEGSESGLPRQVTLRPSWASGPAAGGNWLIGAE